MNDVNCLLASDWLADVIRYDQKCKGQCLTLVESMELCIINELQLIEWVESKEIYLFIIQQLHSTISDVRVGM